MRKLYYLLIFALLFPLFLKASQYNILILHSYHQSYKWTDDINRGINEVFKNNINQLNFYVEYMDSKRFIDKTHHDNLFKLYKQKYNNINFDVIISSDNNALNFVKKYHKTLFKKAPVVFLGANYFTKKEIEGFSNFTGVNEEANIQANYELIQQLHPNIKNIYTVVDNTTTGQKIKQEIKKIKQKLNKHINFEIISEVTLNELKEKIKTLPKNSAVLITVFFRSKDNQVFEYFDISSMISKQTNSPIYGLWDFYLGHGIIGGFLTSGFFQGKEAALMAKKILQKTPLFRIPILYKSPNNYMFDYQLLEKYNIDKTLLPKNSYIINEPLNLYERYKREILSLGILFSFLIVIIISLLMILRQKELSKLHIKKELRFQQTLIDTVDAPIYYKNTSGEYIGCNKAFETFLETSKDSIIGKNVFDVIPKELANLYTQKDEEIIENPNPQQYEGLHIYPDGSHKNLIFYKNVYYDEKGQVQGIVGTIFDITHLKEITKKLDNLNKHLEEKVQERTIELEETNTELEQTITHLESMQKRLVETEVVNSLGNIVAGVAHEINTPVGIGITASTHLEELVNKINLLFKNDEISEEEFENFLIKSQELSQLIHANFEKTAKLIRSFKQVSVEQLKEEKRSIILKEYLQDILVSIKALTKYPDGISINIECQEELELTIFTGALSKIITNLILNSIHHGFEETNRGNINLILSRTNHQLHITYTDDGKGIKQEHLNKIFDPFFTTKRIKGQTGLGLNVIYNIITATFKGKINCSSQEEKGVTFTITLHI